MPNYVAAYNQSCTLGSTPYCVTNSQWTETNDVIEVTGSCSNGQKQFIKGLSMVSGSFDLNFDSTNPPTVHAGDIVSLSNIIGATGTQGLSCSTAIITDRQYTFPVPGVATVTISFNTSGPYTISNT